jgi:hypothetical protein
MCLMASVPGMTNEATPTLGEPFVFSSYGNIGPPYITTLSLLALTIGLSISFFSTQVILNAASASVISTSPQEHQPHVDPSPSSLVRYSSPSSLQDLISFHLLHRVKYLKLVTRWTRRRRRKGRIRRRKINKGPIFQPLPNMLENNQLLIIILGVLLMPRSPKQPVSPSTLTGFLKVSIFLRIYLLYPRL